MDKAFVEKFLRDEECKGKDSLKELTARKEKLDRFLSDPVYEDLYALHEHANDMRADVELELFLTDIVEELFPVIAKCGIPTMDGALRKVDEVKYKEWIERAIMRYYQEKYKK